MDTWVKDVMGLALAADSVMITVGIIAAYWYSVLNATNVSEFVYKNYNYDAKEIANG